MTCARRGVEFARELASTLIPLYCWVSRPCPLSGVSGEARHSCAEIAPSAMIFWGLGGVRRASSLWLRGDVRGQGCSGKRVSLKTDANVGFRSLLVFYRRRYQFARESASNLTCVLGVDVRGVAALPASEYPVYSGKRVKRHSLLEITRRVISRRLHNCCTSRRHASARYQREPSI